MGNLCCSAQPETHPEITRHQLHSCLALRNGAGGYLSAQRLGQSDRDGLDACRRALAAGAPMPSDAGARQGAIQAQLNLGGRQPPPVAGNPNQMVWLPNTPHCDLCVLTRPGYGTLLRPAHVRDKVDIKEGNKVGVIAHHTVLEVHEVVGRRGRITEPLVGWLSLWTTDGRPVVVECPQLWMLPAVWRGIHARLDRLEQLESQAPPLAPPSSAVLSQAFATLFECDDQGGALATGGSQGGSSQPPKGFWDAMMNEVSCVNAARGAQQGGLLTAWEAENLWQHLETTDMGTIGFEAFCSSCQRGSLRRPGAWAAELVYRRCAMREGCAVRDDYDYAKSTLQNHQPQAGGGGASFEASVYREHRGQLERADGAARWHKGMLYTSERVQWQDLLVSSLVPRTPPRARPVALFTAGLPGAGKSYTASWLTQAGVISPDSVVRVDVDAIRQLLPEWGGYCAKHAAKPAAASELTHSEAALIAEIALETALSMDQDVWFDSTMQDMTYFERVFRRLRAQSPSRRVCVLWVTAPEEVCKRRCRERAQAPPQGEGRGVPDAHFAHCLKVLKEPRKALSAGADFLGIVSNDTDRSAPVLQHWEQKLVPDSAGSRVDTSGDWSGLYQLFAG
eukprot:TRINITY_DN50127_c0_g1_i1.p1 TRINITY_DN50127_c0_g1~~TRINITY_DN50127_c0_g1_i1.p1  ORF type:complete len:621 (+),score=165.00 TRINITY_DN50127_c0_g1_i1:96-1958(+)